MAQTRVYRSWPAICPDAGAVAGPGRAGWRREKWVASGAFKQYMFFSEWPVQGFSHYDHHSYKYLPANMPKGNQSATHPFKKYFEVLQIGDQVITERRVITSKDIDRFCRIRADHFYAHI
jgi:oxepin-CoA hydrolase/3-oxo-5,6-dehydrosuberyl-CoA semialdehyde dehydrogenase